MATGLEHIAKKEEVSKEDYFKVGSVMVPPIYIWFSEFEKGEPKVMTAAIRWEGMNFGLSFPVDENKVRARMDCNKLIRHMREVSSVLTLHGKKALDENGELNMKNINEQEALRFGFDPIWDKRVKVVDSLIRVKYIDEQKARELKLLGQPIMV